MTLHFFMLREVTSASRAKSNAEMLLVVDQCQQLMQGCIRNSSENSVTRCLLSSDFWLLTDASEF